MGKGVSEYTLGLNQRTVKFGIQILETVLGWKLQVSGLMLSSENICQEALEAALLAVPAAPAAGCRPGTHAPTDISSGPEKVEKFRNFLVFTGTSEGSENYSNPFPPEEVFLPLAARRKGKAR